MIKATANKFTIKQIFIDNWHLFLTFILANKKEIRPSILHEVSRIMMCQSAKSGYSVYGCTHCNNIKYVPFTCKSRFCNSCGALYSKKRAETIKSKLSKHNHRHIIFTIPQELRIFFLKDRKLLNCLFEASSQTLLTWIKIKYNTKSITPGIVCVLHTFGRDLKWNPHIHMIVTEGGYNKDLEWFDIPFIPYEMLRKKWMFLLLQSLDKKISTPEFSLLKKQLYKKLDDGFYVHAPKKAIMFNGLVDYIVRYIGRPVMAQSRIIEYSKSMVTFWYQPHGATKKVIEKISAFNFISKLIRHIPEYQFKMLRYYGFYSAPNASAILLKNSSKRILRKSKFSSWRKNIMDSFNYDPLNCSQCQSTMELLYTKSRSKSSYENLLAPFKNTC